MSYKQHAFWAIFLLLAVYGCAGTIPRNPVPPQLSTLVDIPGIPHARFFGDEWPQWSKRTVQTASHSDLTRLPCLYNTRHHYLAISGGGANGAFGAGLLCGWTAAGTRPEFTMVTGISTGAYIDGNPDFAGQRSGANDSDKDNFVSGDGWDNYFRMRFKYLLPMGHGKTQIIPNYVLDNGFLKSGASGGTNLNPFKSGRSFFELRPFYRNQQIDGDDIDAESKTNGLDFVLFWDNRDFPLNPTRGNAFRLKVSRDFGLLDSSNSWTSIESEVDLYLPIGPSDWFRQRVFAFDVWTSCSPTWDVEEDQTITGRPPAYSGATLGGLLRMKGFASQRFSDKAAIYYSAEMRLTPRWNPFESWPWLQRHVGVQWFQFAPFAEIGRVAPSWNFADLHSDLKWCAGMAVRAFAKGLVVRMDTAASEDGVNVQMMINYPFQF